MPTAICAKLATDNSIPLLSRFPRSERQIVRRVFTEAVTIKSEPLTVLDFVRQAATWRLYAAHQYRHLACFKRLLDQLNDEPDAALAYAQIVLMQTGGAK